MSRLPNFSALRAFEAAARHGNFSRAAEELHLTHGAISHQVRKLEEELGLPLFLRNGRHVTVTPQGRQFALVLGKAFTEIATAAQALRPAPANTRLTITAIPSFAARWLAPRLGHFIERHPGIEVVLQTSGALQDLEGEGIDVGIRFGRGHYPGLLVQPLMGDVYYPVCSPHYRGGNLPATPAELAQATLLRSLEPWRPWLAAAGLSLAEPVGGVLYEDLSMLIRSAIDGDGVALVRHVVALQEVAAGRLVRLFDMAVPCADAYYLVSPPAAAQREPVRAFRAWLGEEIAAFQAREAPTLLT
ncbi:transcriptional regulator GcvA [Janthinobacterium sp. GMG2]|uniref:transcriptional regulator GcvA n=1 Tax=Janthinobacterium sp. GMG2 TaxID=3096606 RepID=UPI0029F550B4|nr:transcriptional regulator GcvA [Janthinobacterium sp. GMG2]MDX8122550.1 transcriptional regulator GcvA [Janthinobacterium sp. GMG2]